MSEESVAFLDRDDGGMSSGRLLFPADELIRVTDFSSMTVYREGRDYMLSNDRRTILLTKDTRIQSMDLGEQSPVVAGCQWAYDKGGKILPFGEGLFYPYQSLFTYRHSGWDLPVPVARGAKNTENLGNDTIQLTVFGDSISCGEASTLNRGLSPHRPPWPEQVRAALSQKYKVPVELRNISRGGMTSGWAADNAPGLLHGRSDITILAWGMNDASERVEPKDYGSHMELLVHHVQAINPHGLCVLVATSTSNPAWKYSAPDYYESYLAVLSQLAGVGVLVVDVTSLWDAVVSRKSYYDLTGNGLNHPNDYGHNLYGQMVINAILNKSPKHDHN